MAIFPVKAKNLSTTFLGVLGFILILLFSYVPNYFSISIQDEASLVRRNASTAETNHTLVSLARRDDYSCGKGRPCANGACCGQSGFCGYGSTYCGTGCQSNCNATAECGQYANPKGKTCPLNTCCSQYGFCGTTNDFCTTNCQSNCVTNPQPPGGGGNGNVLNRVVGYYESWSKNLKCHPTSPTDLPLDALTHLNYAFAYIDPQSFNIVTMDPQTPESSFQETVNTKRYKPDLQVYVSIGGWTFSDNGTATQPVFGNIASSAANRQKFADNALRFLNNYGFDGIDIDWEYPGAPDRGGKPEDTANFVLLMQTLRNTFNSSPRTLGITFTAPSSYWYLRWFDIPGLLKYTDWINFMTYDLHGTWDRNNPIGSIVQAHTNLTEINLALQLLWRVNTPPSKVSMGFGFYGRSFQLSSSSCTQPGCQFNGGAAPGPCSATSGILLYYEIQALLQQHPELKPVYDQTAAVKYVTYNGNNWISYDDPQTLQQKVKWANQQGLGGSLIWASDTDDAQYSAHSGLLGKTVGHKDLSTQYYVPLPGSVAQNLQGQNGQNCQISDKCVDFRSRFSSICPLDMVNVGYINDGTCNNGFFSFNYMKQICCPGATAPRSCTWRGSGGDCNGQCHVGEANVFRSSWGGIPGESPGDSKCSRGYKVFCCEAGDWKNVISGCGFTDCGQSCPVGYDQVATAATGGLLSRCKSSYCCPTPAKLNNCHWKGSQPDCPDAKCDPGEVTIAQDPQGESLFGCSWGRQKSLCCGVNAPPANPPFCSLSMCDIDPIGCSIAGDGGYGSFKRDLGNDTHIFDKRGGPRRFKVGAIGFITSLPYPSRNLLFRDASRVINSYWRMLRERCDNTQVEQTPIADTTNLPDNGRGQTEHPIDLQVHAAFIGSLVEYRLPSGGTYRTPRVNQNFLTDAYMNQNFQMASGLTRVTPNSPDIRQPAARVFEAMGSNSNRSPLMLVEDQINRAKGRIFALENNMQPDVFGQYVSRSIQGDARAQEAWLQSLRTSISVFRYLNTPDATQRFVQVRRDMRTQMAEIETNVANGTGLTNSFDEWFPDYTQRVQDTAQSWMTARIAQARAALNASVSSALNYDSVMTALKEIEDQIPEMKLPI